MTISSMMGLQTALRGLLAEQVPVRDLSRIVESVATRSLQTRSLEHLVAAARVAVGGAIEPPTSPPAAPSRRLSARSQFDEASR